MTAFFRTGLEIRRAREGTEGSTPSPSAIGDVQGTVGSPKPDLRGSSPLSPANSIRATSCLTLHGGAILKAEVPPMYRRWSDAQLEEATRTSTTYADVLRKLGLRVQPGNYTTIRKYIRRNKLDVSHMVGFAQGTSKNPNRKTLEEVLVQNSDYCRGHLKKRLLKEGLLKEKCCICGLSPVWQDKPLVFVLDHKNGINNDNHLENLRLLCPNCNSQTATFCGRAKKKPRKFRHCRQCKNEIGMKGKTGLCCTCAQDRKVERPSLEELHHMVKLFGFRGTGKRCGVSDNAIRKWLRTGNSAGRVPG